MKTRMVAILGGLLLAVGLVAGSLSGALAQTPPAGTGWGPGGMMGGTTGGWGPGGMMGGSGMMGGPGTMRGPMAGGQRAGMMAGDAGRHFIEMMIPHHEDAVAMADLALAQAEHEEIKTLAATIKRVQTEEIEQMRAWYQQWYGTAPRAIAGQGRMPGMGSPAALNGARPFDKAFIEQMIPHHQMAVMMATMVLPRAEQPELRGLLQSIVAGQSAEIAQMTQWYRDWYGTAVPVVGHGMMGGGMMGGGMMGAGYR